MMTNLHLRSTPTQDHKDEGRASVPASFPALGETLDASQKGTPAPFPKLVNKIASSLFPPVTTCIRNNSASQKSDAKTACISAPMTKNVNHRSKAPRQLAANPE